MSEPSKTKKRSMLVAAARQAPVASSASAPASTPTGNPPVPRNPLNLSGKGTSVNGLPTKQETSDRQTVAEPQIIETKPDIASVTEAESSTASGIPSPDKSQSLGEPLSRASSISGSSTPQLGSTSGFGGQSAIQKMKFKPRVPIRSRVKQEVDVKPEISASPSRGIARGRGRGGGQRGGRGSYQSVSVAAGPFGAPRTQIKQSSRRVAPAPAPRHFDLTDIDMYSDNDSDHPMTKNRVVDIDRVSSLHESAPTSLHRSRKDGSKGKSRSQSRGTSSRGQTKMDVDSVPSLVKAEPMSPEKRDVKSLADESASSRSRSDRVRSFARTGGDDEEDEADVNEANRVDLSESESEEEDEDLRDDFVPDESDEANKLYIFQFPHLFPHFIPPGPVDMTAEEDVKPDVKTTQTKGKKRGPAPPPPEGRIGTLVVMKSGRVKMVLGKDIVMDVNSGVQANFLQQIVHLDPLQKAATVLGEVHKQYTVTPDIDRLLNELYIQGGQTPADREADRRRLAKDVKMEKGLVKLEVE
ncbi:RNA polymerase III RPC4-domain-containing protein [Kockovaella imperatae]|uniref:RNA polymerase III RPC4-domain-containing protein n=1 Tax=Kockovaella imperatae TaxID=4999 RepID=A0A1Y1ULP9_9TREE|nr:RNA polymerase III RPC4-domain-containing protein [Kockovaella imperatae]ORX38045.1 RNA polymerase III RPC4-domain-containing protein [Kockovaella imperatae]